MFKTIKKVWRYIRKYKALLTFAILAMITVQVLNLASPLIVKAIMDDYLVAIEKPWYEINENKDGAVLYNNKYYSQDDESTNGIMVVISKGKYYFIDDLISEEYVRGNKEIIDNGSKITFKSQSGSVVTYDSKLLTSKEVRLFYEPVVNPLMVLVIILAVRLFMQILFTYIQRISTARLNVNIVKDARIDAVTSLQRMPMKYFEEEPAGKIANRVINDVGGMMGLFSTLMNLLLNASMSIVFAYIGMFYLDKNLALISFIIFPLVYIWLKYFVRNLNSIAEKVNEQGSLITAQLNEIINGVSILQIFNYEEETIGKFNDLSRSYMNEQLKETRLHLSLGWNMIRLIGSLVTALIVFYFGNGYLTVVGFTVTAGTIYAYNTYLTGIIEPVGVLFREIGNLQHSLVRTERIFKVIDGEQEDDSFEILPRVNGNIKFDDVWFSYVEGQPVLKGVSFDIKENSMVGIVGHTGSGKSTLMNLLLRFYDFKTYDSGRILIDDIDITTNSKRSYRKDIGIILQDPMLFTGTLADNIKFGADISDEEAIEILKSVGGESLLNKLPNGIHEEMTRGGKNMSIGERQIISFARVIAHNPRILIMDEATANIDTETETMIQNALEKVKKGRTLIVIAHRLSTIKSANKIIVLQKGLKVEEGTHQELLANDSVYANIYRAQIKS
ncbi:ABC transporter ATP-binding protein [Haploplasma axanthum]|uniref:ABC-type multidrug/protein/lipid transport system ATPase component n=1 Tax=Haploplasma axanthum TaxID=29552 RepID=A0A449BFU4_HAPAX|nr:ABC transporter ATP-binding protein [Haploplasma axanthum]VEU81311.1 ABC-type multidrug/protein/lipid transport system ATPase component [Haploplasma axanthum]